jgi:hypothetical protein
VTLLAHQPVRVACPCRHNRPDAPHYPVHCLTTNSAARKPSRQACRTKRLIQLPGRTLLPHRNVRIGNRPARQMPPPPTVWPGPKRAVVLCEAGQAWSLIPVGQIARASSSKAAFAVSKSACVLDLGITVLAVGA